MRRIGPIVVVVILGLVVSLAIIAFAIPRWEFRPLPVGTAGESIQSIAWSPDGSRFLTQENGRYTILRASDGAMLLAVDGYSPVWIDGRTIESLREIGTMRTQLVKLDIGTDYPSPLGAPLGVARLIADRDGHLAARSELGDIITKVLDPTDGRVIATLPGLRAQVWAGSGTLVSKTVDPQRQAQGVLPGSLVAWSAGRGQWPIGTGLVEYNDSVTVSPSGDSIVCVCGPIADEPGTKPRLAITIVPIDGSPATALTPFDARSSYADPVAIWLDDRTLAYVDQSGLHRLRLDGVIEMLPGFDQSELSTPGSFARIAVVGDALAIVTLEGSGPTGIARLTIINGDGSVALRQSFPSWNPPSVYADSNRRRALIVSDPQKLHEPPNRIFVVWEGKLPLPGPTGRLEPSLSPSPVSTTVSARLTVASG